MHHDFQYQPPFFRKGWHALKIHTKLFLPWAESSRKRNTTWILWNRDLRPQNCYPTSSSSNEATRFSAACAKWSMLGSSSFRLPAACSSIVEDVVMWACGGTWANGLLGALDGVELGVLCCEVEECDGDGGGEVVVEGEGLHVSVVWCVEGGLAAGGFCCSNVSGGFPSLTGLVPKTHDK